MNIREFNVLNALYNASRGRALISSDLDARKAMKDRETFSGLTAAGLIDPVTGEITGSGILALEPYKVDNAVILAAGAATRFVPLSLEQPKGLYEVKGEKLIERQIQQLLDAGISDITVVLGYKHEMFRYLSEKFGVKLIFNPEFSIKNNIESLYRAKEALGNTYVCVCDSYFIENPFQRHEFRPFYAGYCTDRCEDEMYACIDGNKKIVSMDKACPGGMLLLGHSFWTEDFSRAFLKIASACRGSGKYDEVFWEWLVKDNLEELPDFYYKEYSEGTIFEFDYFDQLRQFDTDYVGHTRSEIIRNIKLVFRCDEEDIIDFRKVDEGLTNTSFIFRIGDRSYIYRHPGEGTESIINRRNEKTSLIKAKELGIDPTYIYMDLNEGWKISELVASFREPDYRSFEDSGRILKVLRRLHASGVKVDYGMRPWEDALEMERLIREKDPHCFDAHEQLKDKIRILYKMTEGDGVEKCFCHGDTYKPNWMIKDDGEVILIDWEYAGYSDPGIDVGYYIVDAMYDHETAGRFIREYLGNDWSEEKEFHYYVYTALIAYYWFVWAMYRESCGANMGESLDNWRKMAEMYSDILLKQ